MPGMPLYSDPNAVADMVANPAGSPFGTARPAPPAQVAGPPLASAPTPLPRFAGQGIDMTPTNTVAPAAAPTTVSGLADKLTSAIGATADAQQLQANVAKGGVAGYAAALGNDLNITGRAALGVAAAPVIGIGKASQAVYDNVLAPFGRGLVGGSADAPPVPAQVASPAAAAPAAAPLAAGTVYSPTMAAADAASVKAGTELPVPKGSVLTDLGWAPPGSPLHAPAAAAAVAQGAQAQAPAAVAQPGAQYSPAELQAIRATPQRDLLKTLQGIQELRKTTQATAEGGTELQLLQQHYLQSVGKAPAPGASAADQEAFAARDNAAKGQLLKQLLGLNNPNAQLFDQNLYNFGMPAAK